MEALKVLGKEKVADFEFTGIEGGFGKGKRSMLAKDIAKIHNKQIYRINEMISRNIDHFEIGIDLLDLKSVIAESDKEKYGFSQNAWNRSEHIWLVSERGYLKLLKIMDDDKAWDIYNDIVDNYFNMRVAIKEKKPELVENDRLTIMAKNAATKRGAQLMKLAEMADDDSDLKERALIRAFEEMTGETFLPDMTNKEYSATQISNELGITPMRVGMIANQLGIKAEKPYKNKYGRWVKNKSRNSDREVPQWLYFEEGRKAIINEYKKQVANVEA